MIFAIALVLAQQSTGLVPPASPDPSKTVLTVNGQAFTAKQVEPFLWEWSSSKVFQLLASLAFVEQEAVRRKVTLTNKEVDDSAEALMKPYLTKAPAGQDPKKWLRDQGAPMSAFQYQARVQLLLDKMVALDFKQENYVKVSTIVVRPKDESVAAVTAAGATANSALEALQKGEPWDTVVARSTTDQRAAANHGELGWRSIDQFPTGIQKDLGTVKINGYTKPIQTAYGWQIFRVEVRGKDASPQEMAELKGTYLPMMSKTLFENLQKAAKIVMNP